MAVTHTSEESIQKTKDLKPDIALMKMRFTGSKNVNRTDKLIHELGRIPVVYVVDIAKYSKGRPQEPGLKDPEIQKSYYNIATGLIAGNVYLFAASQGLAAWFHNCGGDAAAKDFKLQPDQRVLFAQSVGYPA